MAQKMKESPVDGEQDTKQQPGSPKSRLAMLKRGSAKKSNASQDPFRFQGQGVQFKGKLIGIRDVEGARGDAMCAEAMRQAKAAIKASGSHKQRIVMHINIDGIKINDEKSAAVLYNFPVARISFIARDTSDARAFGFVYGESAGNYKFYGIKTAQTADHAVLSIRDMFQIVFEMKKKQIEQVKQKAEENDKKDMEANGVRSEDGVLVADLLDLETEVHNIEQGLNQMAHIPVVAGDEWPGEQHEQHAFSDPFGTTPFNTNTPQQMNGRRQMGDPFGDSFNTTNQSSLNFSSPAPQQIVSPMQSSVFTTPQSTFTSPAPGSYFPQQQQQQHWMHDQQHQQHHPHMFPQTHSTPAFSTTNPFADMSTVPHLPAPQPVMVDPFDTVAIRQNLQTGQSTINWGTNENTAPHGMTHAHSFTANFENNGAPRKNSSDWDAPKKVTSLEDAFSKLVDMDSLVGRPAETKKNPFDHIINPPKIPLNSLGGAPSIPNRPVYPAVSSSDPFSDAFFN